MSPRILYVITDLQTGGVPLHLYRLAGHVRACGLDVHVTSLASPGPVSRMLCDAGVPTSSCHAAGAWDWRAIDRLGDVIRDVRPDVIHSFLFHANVACRAVVMLGGSPAGRLVCEIQTVEVERRWHLMVERATWRLCRCVVGNSPSVVDHLASRARVPRDRLVLVQGGIDPAPHRLAGPTDRKSLGLSDTDPLVIWTGRLDPVKGLDDLVAAAAQINRTNLVQFLLIGEGADRNRIERLTRQHALTHCLRIPGRRTDIPNLLKMADLFAFPSLTEGMPNALLEAMAAGLPVVATDVPGNRDVVTDGETGLLVPPRDSASLAAAIANLLQNKRLSTKLAQAASRSIDDRFNIRDTYRAYLALYQQVLATGR